MEGMSVALSACADLSAQSVRSESCCWAQDHNREPGRAYL